MILKKIYITYEKVKIVLKTSIYKLMYLGLLKMPLNIRFRKNFNIRLDKGSHCEIGNYCFFNNNCSITCMNQIIIGENCIFGENVKIYDHNHIFNKKNQLIKNSGDRKSVV